MDTFISTIGQAPTEHDKKTRREAAFLSFQSADPGTAWEQLKNSPALIEARKQGLVPGYRQEAVSNALSKDPQEAVAEITNLKAEADTPVETQKAFDLSVFYDDGKSAGQRIDEVATAFRQEIDQYRFVDPRTLEAEQISGVRAGVEVITQLMTNTPFIDIQKEAIATGIVGLDEGVMDLNNTVQSIVNWYDSIPDDQKAEQVRIFLSGLKDRSGFLFENNFDFDSMITHLHDNVVDGGDLNDGLNALVTAAEATVYFPVIGWATKALVAGRNLVVRGAASAALKKNPTLAEKFAEHAGKAGDDELLDAAGTNGAEVANSIHNPKLSPKDVDPDMPYVPEGLTVTDGQAKKKLAEKLDAKAGNYKANEMVLDYGDDGVVKAEAVVGKKKDAQPFKQRRSAETLAEELGGEVVERNGGYMVKITDEISPGRFGNVVDGVVDNRFKRIIGSALGRNVKFKEELNKVINAFNTKGVQEAARFNRVLESNYNKLDGGGLKRVNTAIKAGDDAGERFSHSTLRQEYGLSGREIAAYDDVQWLSERSWTAKNVRVRQKMRDAGYGEINGRIVRPTSSAGDAKTVLDSNGRAVPVGTLGDDVSFYQIVGESVQDHTIVALRAGELPNDVPLQVLGKRAGHLPRIYTDSFFIEESVPVTINGVTRNIDRVIGTAKSEKQAKAVQQRLLDEEGKEVTYRTGRELDNSGVDTELADLEADGLLAGTKRRDDALTNSVSGESNIEDVSARIGRLRSDLARNAGIAKYFDVAAQDIKSQFKKYGQRIEDYSIKGLPPKPQKMPDEVYEKIKAVHRHIQNLQGVGIAQALPFLDDAKAAIGHFALNATNGVIGRGLLGAPGTRNVYDVMKTLSFTGYLALNPFKQIVLQATMLPTYAGVEGGFKYMSSGKLFRDMSIIQTAALSERQALKLATKLGVKASDAKALIREFNDSGLRELVDDHILSLGRADTAGIGKQGRTLNAIKSVGLDIGVGIDKKASFLFSRERFKAQRGHYPKNKADEQTVRNFAEQLSLNQNSSDTLLSQNGVLSLFTQFMSHQLKMSGRILNLEGEILTKAERARMLAVTTMSYGAAGWGLTNAYEEIKAQLGVEVPPEVDLAVKEGLVGTSANILLNLSNLDDPTEFAFSAGFSPTNFAYDQFTNFVPNVYNLFTGGQLPQSLSEFATARLWGDMVDVVKTTGTVLGHVDEYTEFKQIAPVIHDVMTKLPLTNNAFKAYAAVRFNEFINTKGEKIGDVGPMQGAVAALLGIRSRDSEEVSRAWERLMGPYNPQEEGTDGILNAARLEGSTRAKQIIDIIDLVYDGDMHGPEAFKLLENHWRTAKTLFDEVVYAEYRNAVMYEINRKQGENSPSAKLQAVIRKNFTRVLDKQSEIEYIRGIDLPGMADLADELESQFSFTFKDEE